MTANIYGLLMDGGEVVAEESSAESSMTISAISMLTDLADLPTDCPHCAWRPGRLRSGREVHPILLVVDETGQPSDCPTYSVARIGKRYIESNKTTHLMAV